jgi:CRISPR-associated protein Cas5d
MSYRPLKMKVWGEYALFTQPEAKVERVSYPCPTPSAARGMLEAVFWKPEFSWRVRQIQVLKPIHYDSMIRNEVSTVIAEQTVKQRKLVPYYADEEKNRRQRHTLFLRNVSYLILADICLRDHATDHVAKYRDMFQRRLKRGQCFNQPYLGTRECMAYFSEADDNADQPYPIDLEIGSMLFDLQYPSPKGKHATPIFFSARLKQGILHVPDHLYEVVEGNVSQTPR